jgi:hypothetical protein
VSCRNPHRPSAWAVLRRGQTPEGAISDPRVVKHRIIPLGTFLGPSLEYFPTPPRQYIPAPMDAAVF